MKTAEEMYREHYPSVNVQQKDTIILMEKYAKQYAKGELEFLFQSLPENLPLYKDSGLWQLRTDNMKKVLIQQNMNMSNMEFIKSINRAQKTWL